MIFENKNQFNVNIQVMDNKSPLRYPGGKTRACKKLEPKFFPILFFRGFDS